MDNYKVFADKYNKMFDLVEKVDPSLAKKYEKVMSKIVAKMSKNMLEKLENNKEFSCDGADFRIDFDKYDEMIEFQYTTYIKYLNVAMNIYPFYEDELLEEDELDEDVEVSFELEDEEDGNLFIFSLSITNTEDDAKIKINFEENNGKYKYINTETAGLELDYSVFIEKLENEDFKLVSVYKLNGVEAYRKEVPISYEELCQYAVDENDLLFDMNNKEDEQNEEEENFEDFEEYDEEGEWSSDLD